MPIKKTAYKELRKSRIRHFKNISTLSELKTLTKKFENLISGKKTDEVKSFLKLLASKIDKARSKGVIHKNAASRKISRLMKKMSRANQDIAS